MLRGIAAALRWGQTNITEADPARYDIAWWRSYWKRTRVQGVIINAGGIVAYYPSRYPLHHRALALGDRDLFGELTAAAHADGLAVFARMDPNRAHEAFFRARPEWFCRQKNGEPYGAGDQFIACINSGYYDEYLLQILREIIERSHPEGFTDNSWAGLAAVAFVIARIVSALSAINSAGKSRSRKTGTIPFIAIGFNGTTPGGSRFGIRIIA